MINFTLTDLRYLIALADEQHFAKAAQKCFVSQPTLSIAIRKLEDNLGVIIFERENHKVLITPPGCEIIRQSRKILAEAQQLSDLASNYQNVYAHPLKLGAIFTIGPYVFPNLIKKTMEQLPDLQLIIEEGYTDNLKNKLINGELDAILLATDVNHPDLQQVELAKDPLVVVCSSKHKFARQKKLTTSALEQEPFLLLGVGNCFRDQVLQICTQCTEANEETANMIVASSLETIKPMVAMNIGISILPRLALKNLPAEIKIKQLHGQIPSRKLSLVSRKNFVRNKLIDSLAELLTQIINESVK